MSRLEIARGLARQHKQAAVTIAFDVADALLSSPGRTESPILAFQEWLKKTGRSLTQDEYFLAQSAFYAAHPGAGPHSTTASPGRTELPPDVLADALQDRIAPSSGRLLHAAPILGRTTEEEKMAWQPIETAPKDGGQVLLGWPTGVGEGLVMSGYWSDWRGRKSWVTSRGEYSGDYAPTHWMPLPSAPCDPSRMTPEP